MELRSAMRLPPSRHVACRAAAVRLAPRAAGGVSTSISVSHSMIHRYGSSRDSYTAGYM